MKIEPVASDGSIRLRPIGHIRSVVREQQFGGFEDVPARIELNAEFEDYLVGLEDYSHLKVIYWLSEQTESHAIHRPQGIVDVPDVGMFACR